MTILFLNQAHPILRKRLEQLGLRCEEDLTSTEGELMSKIGRYEGLVLRSRVSLRPELLAAATRLRFIAREGVGLEHIDTEFAASQGIAVLSSPEGSRDTVGEHALGLLLMLLNHLHRADRQVRAGEWTRESNRGTEIKGKTIGILGYGNMGQSFARKVSGLEATVIAYDKYRVDYGDECAQAVELDELQARADILSIHIPYDPLNHHFIDGAFLDRFQKPIFLINTARGLVLDTASLVRRLESGKVLGAGLDVLEYEESSFENDSILDWPAPFHYLRSAGNVVLSPHIAGWSFESKRGHAEVLADKIATLLGKG